MLMPILNPFLAFWMPERASSVAGDVDWLFRFILGISVFFFVLIVVLMILFVWRYRYREGKQQPAATSHNTALEITWTLIPTILVIVIFYYGFRGYLHMSVVPPNAYEIQVTGRMWNWSFTYPNGHVDSELHAPVDTPIRLVLSSDDVIHSLFIPAFRIKKDAVPGRYNRFWFRATQIGTFDIYCAEYCGTNHSRMLTKAIIHDTTDFQNWLAKASNWETQMSPAEAGRMFYERRGCMQCHSTDGSRLIGPSFKDLFGHEVSYSGGKKLVADENYIRESIYEPAAKIVDGFDNVMPSFKSSLSDKDVTALIAYLKSISAHYKGSLAGPTTAPVTAPASGGQPVGSPTH
ncbi:MAG: cytochrome c oxidase subunit II [Bacillota bacterium]